MNDLVIWLVVAGSALGFAKDAYDIGSGKANLPMRACGEKVHVPMTIILVASKFIINGFIGGSLGWVTLHYGGSTGLAVIIAGIAGGQGDKLYALLVDKLYNKVDKASDGDVL